MYMYAEGVVKYSDGKTEYFGEEMGYGSIEEVEQYAIKLIREDSKKPFTIRGTLNTDYSNIDYFIEYNGSTCTVYNTDYYWWYGEDDAWFEGDSEDQLENFCENHGIEPDSPEYTSLKAAYENSYTDIYSNDERTQFYRCVPYISREIIYKDGKQCSIMESIEE